MTLVKQVNKIKFKIIIIERNSTNRLRNIKYPIIKRNLIDRFKKININYAVQTISTAYYGLSI